MAIVATRGNVTRIMQRIHFPPTPNLYLPPVANFFNAAATTSKEYVNVLPIFISTGSSKCEPTGVVCFCLNIPHPNISSYAL
jgi:hypothetical protein